MGEKSRNSRASAAALFGGALLVGWICKQAESGRNAASSPTTTAVSVASIAAPFPAQPEDLEVRIWLAEALVEADASSLGAIAAKLADVPELDDRAWHGLFSCWFATDPAAAWAFAGNKDSLRGIALEEWAALDPAAARAAVDLPSQNEWPRLIRGAARKDAAAAFQLLADALDAGLEIIPDDYDSLQSLGLDPRHLAELAHSNPQLAVKWAERMERPSTFFGAVVYGWHESAPQDALAWLEQRPDRDKILFDLADYMDGFGIPYRPALTDLLIDALPAGNDRIEALQHVLESLSWVDPDLAAREAARVFPDPELRAEAIGKIASFVAETDFDKAWEILDQLDPSVQGIRRVNLPPIEVSDATGTCSVNFHSSYEWNLTSMRGIVSPADIRAELLRNLIDVDKEAALRTMEKIPPADLLVIAEPAFEAWQSRDPEEAVRWLAAKLGDQGKLHHAEDLLEHDWQDLAALRDLIRELPEGTVRSALALQAAADLAESDPLAALRFARDSSTAPEVVEEVYRTWAENDARSAFEHLAADPGAPPSAWARIAGEALQEAPEEFVRVVIELTDDAARDGAAKKIVEIMSRSENPLPAADWAFVMIRDESEREAAIEQVFDRLGGDLRLARDPDTAESLRDLISTSTLLPESEKGRWLERIDLEFTPP